MSCWLYDRLKEHCKEYPNYVKFLEAHKKDIRFTGYDEFTISIVPFHIDREISIQRICNIRVPA